MTFWKCLKSSVERMHYICLLFARVLRILLNLGEIGLLLSRIHRADSNIGVVSALPATATPIA